MVKAALKCIEVFLLPHLKDLKAVSMSTSRQVQVGQHNLRWDTPDIGREVESAQLLGCLAATVGGLGWPGSVNPQIPSTSQRANELVFTFYNFFTYFLPASFCHVLSPATMISPFLNTILHRFISIYTLVTLAV